MPDTAAVATIIQAFQKLDPDKDGIVEAEGLSTMFQQWDSSWTWEKFQALLQEYGNSSRGDVKYKDFIRWVMEADEEDGGNDDSDDEAKQDASHNALSQACSFGGGLQLDIMQRISVDTWTAFMETVGDEDDDEALSIYRKVQEDMEAEGKPIEGGLPLWELLQEIKVEIHDGEAMGEVASALEKGRQRVPTREKAMQPKCLERAAHKVVRCLDLHQEPPESASLVVSEGRALLSKAEHVALTALASEELVALVKRVARDPPLLGAQAGQQACVDICRESVAEIVGRCKKDGVKFTDPDWDVHQSRTKVLYVDEQKPGWDCTVAEPAGFKRLSEIVRQTAGPDAKPTLIKDGIRPGDMLQGQIGTCFLLGAIGAVASRGSERIRSCFIKYDIEIGIYGVRFCVDGEWEHVIVDDWMPVDAKGRLLFAYSKDSEEVWCPILEKAYCKLMTCYEMCDGGKSTEAIFAFFGGCSGKLEASKAHRKDPSKYFELLQGAWQRGWLLTAGFAKRPKAAPGAGKCGEAVMNSGLVAGHAYSVLKTVEAHGNQLVCLRNPWGAGEWTGKWSDKNASGEWTQEMREATGFQGPKNDGKFWMSIEDFVTNCASVDYARTFGPSWKKVTQYSHFQKGSLLATAQWDFKARSNRELSFGKGEEVVVQGFPGAWWAGYVKGKPEKRGFFPGSFVSLHDRPVARFNLAASAQGSDDMTVVVMLMQRDMHMLRKWYKRQDNLNYKDIRYSSMQLVVKGPDGKQCFKKQGKARSLWGQMVIKAGSAGNAAGPWEIFASATSGSGAPFALRVYIKGGSSVSLREEKGALLSEVLG